MKVYEDYGTDFVLKTDLKPVDPTQDTGLFHLHPQYEILWVLDSVRANTIINGKNVETDYPMAVITAPYCMHHTVFLEAEAKEIRRYQAFVPKGKLGCFGENTIPLASLLRDSNAVVISLRGYERRFRELTDGMMRSSTGDLHREGTKTEIHQQLLLAAMINLLEEYSDDTDTGFRMSEKNYVTEVMVYIVQNLDTELTIPKIAETFFVSRDKLYRDFRKYVRMNIGDFISAVRINAAKNYLAEAKMTIKEISNCCGFENDIYFYSFFKKHVGMTPKEYARAKRREAPLTE